MSKKSTKRRNAVIAGVAAAALFMGGSTYALWSSEVTITGGQIRSGNLRIEGAPLSAWDVSGDRTDQTDLIKTLALLDDDNKTVIAPVTLAATEGDEETGTTMPYGHPIQSLETWRMVPGDTVAIAFPYKITLVGDNLVARLRLWFETQARPQDAPTSFCDFTDNQLPPNVDYQVFGADGKAMSEVENLCVNGAAATDFKDVGFFQARNEGQDDGDWEGHISPDSGLPMPIATVGTDGTTTVVLVLYVNFSSDVTGRDFVNVPLASFAQGVHANLSQVRCQVVGQLDKDGNPIASNFNDICVRDHG